jgi:hypothetical protein
MKRYQRWEHNYQIRLEEDLKYAFNDVLDIKSYEIKAAYNVYAKVDSLDLVTLNNGLINARQGSQNVNIESINSEANQEGFPIITDQKAYGYYEVTTVDTNWFTFDGSPDYTHDMDSSIKYNTPFLPIDAFKPFTLGLSLMNEGVIFRDVAAEEYDANVHVIPNIPTNVGYEYDLEIELKLMVDVVFNSINSDGVHNSTTLLLTYKINPEDITPSTQSLNSFLSTSSANLTQFPAHGYFSDTDFHGQQVEGCNLDYNQYTCTAFEDITIAGDITVGYGFHVDFKAGNEINVINESNISPEAVLQIESLYNYSQPMPKVDQSFVTSFCDKNNINSPYSANTPRGRNNNGVPNVGQESENIRVIDKDIEFNLFPNPTTNNTTVVVNSLRNENLTIKLQDVSGKEINIAVEKQNDNSFVLDVSNLESGIYFVTVSTFGGSKTKRLVVNH